MQSVAPKEPDSDSSFCIVDFIKKQKKTADEEETSQVIE